MEQNLHFLLMSTHSSFSKKVFAELNGSGLTSGQPKILDYLKTHDGCMQKDIASACEIEPATVTNLLSRMEEAGLTERRSINGDRRSLYVFLTEKGKETLKLVTDTFNKIEEISFSGFTEAEQEHFLSMLMKIYNNVCSKNRD